MTEEIYPMPFFVNLVVRDLEASSKFYQETLGFQHIFTMPGPGVSLSFQMLERFDGSVDALAEQAKASDASIASGLLDQP